ncbi:MAG: galactokinase [Candidatus Promineifilaceae bacterium]
MKDNIIQSFRELYGRDPEIVVKAPGRVNLLGAHTDYNEGWVLPAAIEQAIWLAASPLGNDLVRIASLDFGHEGEATLAELAEIPPRPSGIDHDLDWLNYPAGVAWAMQAAGHQLTGMQALFSGDIPVGAGVSSSAAVEMAFVLAWETLSGLTLNGRERAKLGQQVENGYLGLQSGIMDQFASLYGSANHLIMLDCRTLAYELIPLPSEAVILVVDSSVRRQLASSNYNTRRDECEEATKILQQYLPNIRALRDVDTEAFELYAHRLPMTLRRRARHVVEECARVLNGAEALRQGQIGVFGEMIRESHISCRDLYEISVLELDILAAAAWQVPGCYGARLVGGGFGGCVAVLAQESAVAEISRSMEEAFQEEFGRKPPIFVCRASDGAEVFEV